MSLFFFLLCLSNQRQHRRAPTETKATVGSTPNSGHRGRTRRQCSPLIMRNMSNCISSCKLSVYFTQKKLFFLFYTPIFTKHSRQSIYFTHLFNKIFILLQFFIISSLTTPFSHRHNTTKKY